MVFVLRNFEKELTLILPAPVQDFNVVKTNHPQTDSGLKNRTPLAENIVSFRSFPKRVEV